MNIIQRSLHCLLVVAVLGVLPITHPLRAAETEAVVTSARKSPDWLKSAVAYEIFPRNFSQAGDFNAITARLDELKDLGVDILWLMPIHPTGQKLKKGTVGSPYCVRDFYGVNPDYGTPAGFKRLVQQAHARGMKVILDIVTGHTAWDNALITEHPEFYQKNASGQIIPPNPAWTDVAGLNYTNQALRSYMIDVMKYWVKDFGVDGFRCDVAYTVPTDFWEAARAELDKVNPQLVILADAGAKPALLSKAFDMDYSWHLSFTLNQVMGSVSPAYYLKQSWEHTQRQFPKGALHLRLSDTHGVTRAVARFGMDGALAAQVLMLTLDGVPMFYNGMEVGDATESNDPALFEKVPVFWNPGGRPPLRSIYRDLIKLRKKHSAFSSNEVVWLQNSSPAEVVSFMRRDAKDEFVVLINLSSRAVSGSVELEEAKDFTPVKIIGLPQPVGSVLPEFNLKGYGWFLYHRTLSK